MCSMVDGGASGCLLKNAGKLEMIEAIKLVEKGKIYMSFDAGKALQSEAQQQSRILPSTKKKKRC